MGWQRLPRSFRRGSTKIVGVVLAVWGLAIVLKSRPPWLWPVGVGLVLFGLGWTLFWMEP